jgi:hypothetical protein
MTTLRVFDATRTFADFAESSGKLLQAEIMAPPVVMQI